MTSSELEIRPNTYYTLGEAAQLLRVSPRSINALLNSGEARGVKIGRQWRVLGRELLELPYVNEPSNKQLTKGLMQLSEPSFARVWDNDADAVYDDI